jgi:hypothetical protein
METIDAEKGPEAGGGPHAAHPRRVLVIALLAGLAAGLVAWLGGEAVHGRFAPPDELLHSANFARSPELAREQTIALIKNATLAFGLLGAVLGLVLGVAGGVGAWLRGGPHPGFDGGVGAGSRAGPHPPFGHPLPGGEGFGLRAAAIGLVAGGAAGAGLAQVLVPIAAGDLVSISESLVFAMLIHGGIWSAIGAAGGLAFGIGIGGRAAALPGAVGGLVGAVLGTIVYDLAGAVIAPLAETGAPLSATWGTRLLARVAVCVLAALGAAWATAPSRQTNAAIKS